jgi:hypothetical protein
MIEQKFQIPIYSISTEMVEPPFDEVISALQKAEIEIPGAIDDLTKFLITHCINRWDTVLHWVTKLKWNKKHKIPGGQESVRAAKPMGTVLFHELELCIQSHALLGYKKAGYLDASIWFGKLFMEHQRLELNNMLTVSTDEGGKSAYLASFRRDILAALKEDRNPFDPVVEPHMYKLIECSLKLVDRSDIFREKYWEPYKRCSCISEMKLMGK